ncbi:MAG: NADH ubiquinone oxidoreductase, partial [Rhodobacterales bacterium]
MQRLIGAALAAILACGVTAPLAAEEVLVEDFTVQPETRWRFFADSVMGGVSTGRVRFVEEGGRIHAQMTGTVSTANNGGFIQMRLDLATPPAEGTTGVRLIVRGNDQRYFVH